MGNGITHQLDVTHTCKIAIAISAASVFCRANRLMRSVLFGVAVYKRCDRALYFSTKLSYSKN
ncbi:hypothetical protein [Dendronalium sp. ChiSLP03b]|uniref:hypothetical protein n=1 Tax=Dendronalium sp. ChiSLP03b TaxID=3075381 RepID=UPI003918B592